MTQTKAVLKSDIREFALRTFQCFLIAAVSVANLYNIYSVISSGGIPKVGFYVINVAVLFGLVEYVMEGYEVKGYGKFQHLLYEDIILIGSSIAFHDGNTITLVVEIVLFFLLLNLAERLNDKKIIVPVFLIIMFVELGLALYLVLEYLLGGVPAQDPFQYAVDMLSFFTRSTIWFTILTSYFGLYRKEHRGAITVHDIPDSFAAAIQKHPEVLDHFANYFHPIDDDVVVILAETESKIDEKMDLCFAKLEEDLQLEPGEYRDVMKNSKSIGRVIREMIEDKMKAISYGFYDYKLGILNEVKRGKKKVITLKK